MYTKNPEQANPQRQNAEWWLPGAQGTGKWKATAPWVQGFLLG